MGLTVQPTWTGGGGTCVTAHRLPPVRRCCCASSLWARAVLLLVVSARLVALGARRTSRRPPFVATARMCEHATVSGMRTATTRRAWRRRNVDSTWPDAGWGGDPTPRFASERAGPASAPLPWGGSSRVLHAFLRHAPTARGPGHVTVLLYGMRTFQFP